MKIPNKVRWGICLVFAFVLIGMGFLQWYLGVEYEPELIRKLEFGMFCVVLYLLVIYPRSHPESANKEKEKIQGNTKR